MNEEINSPPQEVRKCDNCGQKLKAGQKHYCSKTCERKFADKKWIKVCANCKIDFVLSYKRRANFRRKPNAKQFHNKQCFIEWLGKNKLKSQTKNNGQSIHPNTEAGNPEQI